MTELTMTQLAVMVVDRVAKEPLTDKGIEEFLRRTDKTLDESVARNFASWMVGKRFLKLNPGSDKVSVWIPGDEAYKLREAEE